MMIDPIGVFNPPKRKRFTIELEVEYVDYIRRLNGIAGAEVGNSDIEWTLKLLLNKKMKGN
jgi:hypothetical protein